MYLRNVRARDKVRASPFGRKGNRSLLDRAIDKNKIGVAEATMVEAVGVRAEVHTPQTSHRVIPGSLRPRDKGAKAPDSSPDLICSVDGTIVDDLLAMATDIPVGGRVWEFSHFWQNLPLYSLV